MARRATHVSDQYSKFGTQIIASTERRATFTLDEILGNTTELPLLEHTTDSYGQTLATFANVRPRRPTPLAPNRGWARCSDTTPRSKST